MDSAVVAAWIGACVALVAALTSAYLTVWSSHHQRAVDLVVAALSHMGGGTQERSAGVAALMALRGPLDLSPGYFNRRGWAIYGPAIGQQLFRQLIYLLHDAKQSYHPHEVENVIQMTDWLLKDQALLQFEEHGQRHRLAVSLKDYLAKAPPGTPSGAKESRTDLRDTSIDELRFRSEEWLRILSNDMKMPHP